MKRSGSIIGVLLLAAVLFAGASLAARLRAPHNRAAPKIAGTAVEGRTLAARRGRWANRPTRFRYAWQSCNRAGRSCVSAGVVGPSIVRQRRSRCYVPGSAGRSCVSAGPPVSCAGRVVRQRHTPDRSIPARAANPVEIGRVGHGLDGRARTHVRSVPQGD